jgi:hypothetical protein
MSMTSADGLWQGGVQCTGMYTEYTEYWRAFKVSPKRFGLILILCTTYLRIYDEGGCQLGSNAERAAKGNLSLYKY